MSKCHVQETNEHSFRLYNPEGNHVATTSDPGEVIDHVIGKSFGAVMFDGNIPVSVIRLVGEIDNLDDIYDLETVGIYFVKKQNAYYLNTGNESEEM